jgi:succinoglycan biosynthesis transport protein ExoP
MRPPNMPAPANHPARSAPTLAMPDSDDIRAYPVIVTSLGIAARHLRSHVCRERGYRTLVTGMTVKIDARQHGAELVRLLPGPGVRAVFVDWNTDGRSIAEVLGASSRPGLMELFEGAATLAQVIQPLPGAEAHIIASGGPSANRAMLDADRVNLTLDALDEAYDHIVFSGEYDALRHLFTTVEGRFDTVLEIEAQDHRDRSAWSSPGMLFGYQVAGIEILRLSAAAVASRRPGSLVRHSAEALA